MNQPAVTLYSKDPCVQCTAAKRFMNRKGIDYTIVDVTKDADALKYITGLGYKAVPVTVVDTETQPVHWFGANPTLLDMHFPKVA
ncbi:glutaredoxin family protein [Arthrobacter sp. MDT1-65]